MSAPYPLPLALALKEGRRALRRRALEERTLQGLFAGGLLGAFLALALLLSALLWGSPWPGWIPWILGLGPLAAGGLAGFARGISKKPSDLETALALDREAGLPDRISTAVEFWVPAERGPFQEAAVADGLDAAASMDPERVLAGEGPPDRAKKAVFAAALALAAALGASLLPGGVGLSPPSRPSSLSGAGLERARVPGPGETPRERKNPPSGGKEEKPPVSPRPQEAVTPSPESGKTESPREEPAEKGRKSRQGRTGGAGGAGTAGKGGKKNGRVPEGLPREARGARAGTSSGASTSQGSPGGGAGKPGKKRNVPRKNKKKKQRARKPSLPAKGKKGAKTPLSGGSMAAGTSRMGGNFAPVTHSWKTLDRGGNEDSGGEDEDQEVNEEKRRSRQRGGTQPSLRDRRPPPSRDLALSRPGDQPGKGRGGPTPPKKDRGTAALILGLPLPDTIKGLPNPGTSRVEQERTSPRESPVPPGPGPLPAAGRGKGPSLPGGRAPAGESGVVERYFRRLRGEKRKPPKGAGR